MVGYLIIFGHDFIMDKATKRKKQFF